MCADAGYMFDSYEQIEPLLERPYDDKSVTLDLAKELATRLQCAVIAGFPEAATERALAEQDMPSKSMQDARLPREAMGEASYLPRVSRKAYNAALLVNNDGSLVKVFRKHFLYEADTTWSDEGTCFRARLHGHWFSVCGPAGHRPPVRRRVHGPEPYVRHALLTCSVHPRVAV